MQNYANFLQEHDTENSGQSADPIYIREISYSNMIIDPERFAKDPAAMEVATQNG